MPAAPCGAEEASTSLRTIADRISAICRATKLPMEKPSRSAWPIPRRPRKRQDRGPSARSWPQAVTSAVLALAASPNAHQREVAARILVHRGESWATSAPLTLITDTDHYVSKAAGAAMAGRDGADVKVWHL
jgi:hypothetical protein